jgi:hypothetical protein
MNAEDLFRKGRVPPAPEALRRRVMDTARLALAARPDDDEDEAARGECGPLQRLVDPVWESRGARLGWAVLCAALIAGHAALSRHPEEAMPPAAVVQEPLPDLGIDPDALSVVQRAQLWRAAERDPL